MERTIAAGRDTFHVTVASDAWTDFLSTDGFTMIADIVTQGRGHKIEFRSRDVRDLIALHVHLSYEAAFRSTALDREMVRPMLEGFEHGDKRIVLPFLQEDEVSWVGRVEGDRVVLANPVVHYGHAYVEWRDKVCEPYDRIVLPMAPGGLRISA
jgi:hypothetical protein